LDPGLPDLSVGPTDGPCRAYNAAETAGRETIDVPSCLEVRDLEGLAIIRNRGVQLARLRRAVPDELRLLLADPESFGFVDLHATLDPWDPEACERLFSELGPLAWLPALKHDAVELARVVAEIAGRSTVHLTLESVYGESCRKWHTDRVGLRMIVTYHGPGTLCAEGSGVDRSWLGSVTYDLEETNRRIVFDPACIVEACAGEVLLCKGDTFVGETGSGLVHRSPSVEGSGLRRLLLRIDERGCRE